MIPDELTIKQSLKSIISIVEASRRYGFPVKLPKINGSIYDILDAFSWENFVSFHTDCSEQKLTIENAVYSAEEYDNELLMDNLFNSGYWLPEIADSMAARLNSEEEKDFQEYLLTGEVKRGASDTYRKDMIDILISGLMPSEKYPFDDYLWRVVIYESFRQLGFGDFMDESFVFNDCMYKLESGDYDWDNDEEMADFSTSVYSEYHTKCFVCKDGTRKLHNLLNYSKDNSIAAMYDKLINGEKQWSSHTAKLVEIGDDLLLFFSYTVVCDWNLSDTDSVEMPFMHELFELMSFMNSIGYADLNMVA